MRIDILSLFPEYFRGPFDESIIKRAREKGLLDIRQVNIRDFAKGRHKKVDDRPFGGGPGMVIMPQPVSDAIRAVREEDSKVIYLSPQGKKLDSKICRELSLEKHLILLCGHYEGIDERVINKEVDLEISIGDFVLTNGCLAAIVLLDALVRFVPKVLGNPLAAEEDSFEDSLFDAPQYTKPVCFDGVEVPEVLRGGHHARILDWQYSERVKKTKAVRPDLFLNHQQLKKSCK